MEKLFRGVLKHRKVVITAFVVLTIICATLIPRVQIDADMSDYLPTSAPSKQDLDFMKDTYGNDITNARVYITGISQVDAQKFDEKLEATDGVISTTWLGDEVDLAEPLEVQDEDTISDWYDGKGYLFEAVLSEDVDQAQIDQIREEAQALPGAKTVAIDGSAASNASSMSSLNTDMTKIMAIAVAVVFLIVALNTTSYLHPVVMLLTIGVAIVLNMGTNIFRGTISNITQLVSSVLQLAVSMDYSIVLLTNFGRESQKTDDDFEAMVRAMTVSLPVILSSAAVTFFGFLSLAAMQFLIGADMGIALAKGIVCSFFAITLLMPCILFDMRRLVAKTTHKPFFKSFKGMANFCHKAAIPAFVIAIVLAVPCLKASNSVSFTYGAGSSVSKEAQVSKDEQVINKAFGESQTWAIMVPEGNWAEEQALIDDLNDLPTTKSVLSYLTVAGQALPSELATEEQTKQVLQGGWSRIVLTSRISGESSTAFDLVDTVRSICANHYGKNYKLVGNTVSYADIKAVTGADNLTVKLASILAIGVVLIVMFKSASLPVLMILAIEVSIWINEAVPYFTGETINFVCFLVIDAVQLGAAVDYSIIYTEDYLARRKRLGKRQASLESLEHAAQPILTSSFILILACLGIYAVASSPMINQVGMLIARGALISVILIFFVLPHTFELFDWIIAHTSYKIGFAKEPDRDQSDNDQQLQGAEAR